MTLNKKVLLSPTRSFVPGMEPPATATQSPDYGQVFKDAFALENTAVAAFSAISDAQRSPTGPDTTGFDPFQNIEGTIFEEYPEALIDVDTEDEKAAAETKILDELARRERLASAGALGMAATFAAGILDPLILLPVGGQITAARALIATAKVSRTARAAQLAKVAVTGVAPAEIVGPLTGGIMTARAAMLGQTASEIVLQADQDVRTFGESALNVTAATFLGGVMGAGVAGLSARSRKAALAQVEEDFGGVLAGGSSELDSVKLTEADLVRPTDGSASGAEIKIQNALGLDRLATMKGLNTFSTPYIKIISRSHSPAYKKAAMELMDPPVRTTGLVTGSSVEAEILEANGLLHKMFQEKDRLYTQYRTRIAKEGSQESAFVQEGGRLRRGIIRATDVVTQRTKGTDIMSPDEFTRRAGAASRSRDSGIPEVDELGKFVDDVIYKPILDDAIDLKLLPEEVRELGPKGARRYLQRSYLQDKLIAKEDVFKSQKIKPWLTGVMEDAEINSILKKAGFKKADIVPPLEGLENLSPMARRKFTPEQATAIDEAIDGHVHTIFENLTGSTRGRTPYERMPVGKGSPFRERALTWSDENIEEFLEQDIETLTERYIRTVVPDLAVMRKFGSLDLKEQIDQGAAEYAEARAKAKTPKERAKIQRQQAEDKKQLLGSVALLRGTYNVPSDNPLVTAARVTRAVNYHSMGGGFGLNSIPDVGLIPMRNGLVRSFRTGYIPWITHIDSFASSKQELQLFGAAIDLSVDTRGKALADIGDDFAQNKTQQAIQSFSNKMSIVNLLGPWNSMMKGIAGNVSMTRMIEAIVDEGAGKISARELSNLEFARLTPDIRSRILVQLNKQDGMVTDGPLKWSNTTAWDDLEARQEWGRAVRLSVDNTILTPGVGATPLWLNKEEFRTIFQFQRFGFGATNTIMMMGVQDRRFLSTWSGLVMMSALGMLVEATKNRLNDRPNPEGVGDWVTAGIDRTGLLGTYGQMYNVTSKVLGKEALSSRFAARNFASTVFGPSLGTVQSGLQLPGKALQGEFTDKDLNTLRRLIPYNQVPYLQWGFDQIEDGVSKTLNLPNKRNRRRN